MINNRPIDHTDVFIDGVLKNPAYIQVEWSHLHRAAYVTVRAQDNVVQGTRIDLRRYQRGALTTIATFYYPHNVLADTPHTFENPS